MMDVGRHPNITLLTQSEVERVSGYVGNFEVQVRKSPRLVLEESCTACGDCEKVCPVSMPSEFDLGLGTRKAIYRSFTQAIPPAFTIDKRGTAPCAAACPAGTRAQGYIALIADGRFQEAMEVSRRANPLTSICGRVCYHPCEDACSRGKLDEPVAIGALKRFMADYVAENGDQPVEPVEITREDKVAIVGSGPSGLTAAHDLVHLGYDVTVFEALSHAGGMLYYGIPAYRLPKDVLAQEIGRISDLGVKILTDHRVDDVGALVDGDYSAVLVAVGAHKDHRMMVDGEDLAGSYSAINFLRGVNAGDSVDVGRRVYVVGGGNTAIDTARSCRRLGAEVTVLYRRSRAEMPALSFEVEAAEEEGVKIEILTNPTRLCGEDGKVSAVECVKMELGEPDDSGRRRPIPIDGSEFTLEADTVIFAIGQAPDLPLLPPGVEVTRWGTMAVDPETLATSQRGVFAAGDAVTGPLNAIEAIAAGHRASESIHEYLANEPVEFLPKVGDGEIAELTEEEIDERVNDWGYEIAARPEMPEMPVEQRLTGFAEVELGLSQEAAMAEAKRCLACGGCSECMACVEACGPACIDHSMKEEIVELEVGTIIVATGFGDFDPHLTPQYSYGLSPNILTGLEFERLYNASGPTSGRIMTSEGVLPESVAILHCIGSRDEHTNKYCSRVCCMYALKQAHIVQDMTGAQVYEFYMDIRAFGKGYEEFYERVQEDGVHFVRGKGAEIMVREDGKLVVKGEDADLGRPVAVVVDMAILATGSESRPDAADVAALLGISRSEDGFFLEKHPKLAPVSTASEGIFLAGACQSPKDIPDTVAQAGAAAAAALTMMDRGTVTIEPYVSQVNESLCVACGLCVEICPYSAIQLVERRPFEIKAEVNEVLCKGCGLCVAACRGKALSLRGFSDQQLLAEVGALLWAV